MVHSSQRREDDDVLVGGAGKDVLVGGRGADEFRFATGDTGTNGATADRVSDFSSSEGDKLDVTETELSSFIDSGAFTQQAGEVRAVGCCPFLVSIAEHRRSPLKRVGAPKVM